MVEVPPALRKWFLVHFIVDMIFAVPLLIAPEWFLGNLGIEVVDPFTARLVGAALIGIGGESLLAYKADAGTYNNMLNLKLLWSSAAVAGLVISTIETVIDGNSAISYYVYNYASTYN